MAKNDTDGSAARRDATVSRKISTVYLLRHARAAWARSGQRDFDRPLDTRGNADAQIIAAALARLECPPGKILCSTALRCRQTCDAVLAHLPDKPAVEYSDRLYDGDHTHYLERLAEQRQWPVLLIGHNPMMEDTARRLATSAQCRPGACLREGFPKAGLAIITFRIETPPDFDGHLAGFLTPSQFGKAVKGAG